MLFLIFINDLRTSVHSLHSVLSSIFAYDTSLHTAGKSTSASRCATLSADLHGCSSNLGGQMGNAIQRPKEQTSFDRKEGKADLSQWEGFSSHRSAPKNILGYCSTSSSHGATIFPVYIPPVPEWWGSCDASTEPFIHQQWRGSTPQSSALAWSMCAQCGAEGPQDVSNAYKPHCKTWDTHCHSLLLREERFEHHTLVLCYRVRANLAPTYFSSLVPPLTSTKSGYSFRKKSYPVPLTKKSATLNNFFPRAIFSWNALPAEVQSSNTLTFKNRLRAHLSL